MIFVFNYLLAAFVDNFFFVKIFLVKRKKGYILEY